ncbi:MAG: peptidase M15, partial [Phocaeicola vulgatus]|nr:peptidase M15 [Phocaeicola vulgatus]
EAADIDTGDRQQNKLLFEYIRKNLPYDQLIDESNFAWVHVSYRADGNNRMQVLKL